MTEETKKNNPLLWIILAILVIALGVLGYLYWNQHTELTGLVEQMAIEKEELQEEYEDLAIQFDGYQNMDIRNDSLQDLLSREQQRVQDLLEELRQTKASDARRIAELKKELATVRAVLKDYVRQIDSLNATNRRLTVENQQVKAENQQVKEQNSQLSTLNSQLSETVTRAAMLEMTSCTLTTLNKRDKRTRLTGQIRKLQFDFTIAKNITCTPGMKDLYARITSPDGELLGETDEHLFHFENQDINYTLTLPVEYSGEAYNGTCYWPIEEIEHGFYTIDFFCDGNLIGSFPFQIKK